MAEMFTSTRTRSFTITHARHLAAKVATDLKRIQRLYGRPSDSWIADHREELVMVLKRGFLSKIAYGFQRADKWIEPMVKYQAQNLIFGIGVDDDPGRIKPGADVAGARFNSYLWCSQAWWDLSEEEREDFRRESPIKRVDGDELEVNGYLSGDRTYSAGGRSLARSTVRSF